MGAWSLAVVAGIVLAYIALQTWRPGVVPPAIAFTAAGLVVGTEGLGWVELSPDAGSLRLLAEATLALVLFSDASRIDLRALRDGYAVPARLLGIGLPLTIAAGTLVALVVLPRLSPAEALVLAIVLAATDAALGQAVVTDERLPASGSGSGRRCGGMPIVGRCRSLRADEQDEEGGVSREEAAEVEVGHDV
jgi:sodium/hydrogen antiporter